MSRSIHETRRQREEIKRSSFSDESVKKMLSSEIAEKLKTKRSIKATVKRERNQINRNELPVAESVDIIFPNEDKYSHYFLSRNDVVNLIAELPFGITNGLKKIEFCSGVKDMEEESGNSEKPSRDPYTGRISEKSGGQVFIPPVLGVHYYETNIIHIYSYVYSDSDIKINSVLFLCKIRQLTTLVHEIAHHDDNMRRTGRGRWLGCVSNKTEDFALKEERKWSMKAIIPFLKKYYADDCEKCLRWIENEIGIRLELEDILQQTFLGSGWYAIMNFMESVLGGKSRQEALYALAEDFHFNDQYEICLKGCDALLKMNASALDALCLKSDTLIHLSKFEEAEILAKRCVEINSAYAPAVELLCTIYEKNKKWEQLYECSSRGLELTDLKAVSDRNKNFLDGITACLHLGKIGEARKGCENIAGKGFYARIKKAFISLIDLCEGYDEDALIQAESILKARTCFRREKSISYFVYQEALKKLKRSGNFYHKPRSYDFIIETFGLNDLIIQV